MEWILAIVAAIAVAVVVIAAKRGAEAAQRERERRWGELPVRFGEPSVATRPRARPGRVELRPPARDGGSPSPPSETRGRGIAAAPAGVGPRPAGAGPVAGAPRASVPRRPARPPPPPVDINSAGVEELQDLPGVGVRAAHRIVAHRERHGRFVSVSDLEAVEGFDHHRVGQLASRATVSTGQAPARGEPA